LEITKWLRLQWDRVGAWLFVVAGGIALIVGWVGVSGTAYPADQLPYILSGGVAGVFLLGVGAMLWLSADLRDEWRKLDAIEKNMRHGVQPQYNSAYYQEVQPTGPMMYDPYYGQGPGSAPAGVPGYPPPGWVPAGYAPAYFAPQGPVEDPAPVPDEAFQPASERPKAARAAASAVRRSTASTTTARRRTPSPAASKASNGSKDSNGKGASR
jgi:hypothetical protein